MTELKKDVNCLAENDTTAVKKQEATSDELEQVGEQNRTYKEHIKELTKDLRVATKKMNANLESKYEHKQKKVELAVEKERLALERVKESRRKVSTTLDKQQQYKKDLLQDKKRAAIDLTVAREKHK